MSRQRVQRIMQRLMMRWGYMSYRLAHRLGIGMLFYQTTLRMLTWLLSREWLLHRIVPQRVALLPRFAEEIGAPAHEVRKAHVLCEVWNRLFIAVMILGDAQEIAPLIRITGQEHLAQARQGGHGVILVMPHMWGTLHAFVVRWAELLELPIEVILGNRTRQFRKHDRVQGAGLNPPNRATERGGELLDAYAALRAGKMVVVLPDGRHSPQFELAVVCGRIHEVRPGFAQLAALSGATVVPAYSVMEPSGSMHIHFGTAFQDKSAETEADRVTCLVNQFAAFQEQTWRAHPGCVPFSRIAAHLGRSRAESSATTARGGYVVA